MKMRRSVRASLLFGAISVFFGARSAFDYVEGNLTKNYESTSGKITESSTELDITSKHHNFTPKLKYRYSVNGKEYQSDRISYPNPSSMLDKFADEYVAKYPVGADVDVYYDSKDPNHACLHKGVNTHDLFVPLAMFLILGITSLILAFIKDRAATR